MQQKIKEIELILEQYQVEMQQNLCKLLQIESVLAEAGESCPFGVEIGRALDFVLGLAAGWGFVCENDHGYVGLVDWGSSDFQIGVLTHIDVVPAGSGWQTDPFCPRIIDGRIVARGAIDDKGPLMAVLYAFRAIKESGVALPVTLRHIIGTNEENGSQCLAYFLKHHTPPAISFSPDAEFPLIHGEKGILQCALLPDLTKAGETDGSSQVEDMILRWAKGGTAVNIIPDEAEACLKLTTRGKELFLQAYNQFEDKDGIAYDEKNGEVLVHAIGQAAHGSLPDSGYNAVALLLRFLSCLPLSGANGKYCRDIAHLMAYANDGGGLDMKLSDEYSCLTAAITMLNIKEIAVKDQESYAMMDMRFPVSMAGESIINKLHAGTAAYNIVLGKCLLKEPHFLPVHHPLVRQLLMVYKNITGDDSPPLVIGGGTYAREMKNSVAFGPVFPGEVSLAHHKGESISCENLLKLAKIYAVALCLLADMPKELFL